jgi:tetratricopeptide (TPR) repeat protein
LTARLARAHVLLRQSRPDAAEQELRQELAAEPQNPEAHGLLAICLSMRQAWNDATAEASEAIRLAPDWAFPHYAMARVMEDRGRVDVAEQAIAEAIRLDPRHAGFFAMLARLRLERDDWQGALNAAEHGLSLDPEDTGSANLRAMALVKLGRRADASSALGSALAREPDNALTHANQGWALLHRGEHKRALGHFQEALRLDPTLDWARQGLVEALKARNPVYGLLLRYFLWMSRLSPRARWGILIGGAVLARFLGPVALVYLGFVVLTWIAEPMSNLALRLSPYGRLVLSREETLASNWLGAALAAGVLSLVAGLVLHDVSLFAAAAAFGTLTIPVSGTFSCDKGWPRQAMAAYAALCAFLVVSGLALSRFPGGDPGEPNPLLVIAILAGLIGTWVANILMTRRVRH